MKIRIESTTGEHVCDLDLKELDVEKMVAYGLARLQLEPNGVKYELPLKESDITKILEYTVISILEDEMKKEKTKK